MDQDTIKEQSLNPHPKEQEEPKEIVLDKPTARAFGRLLRQQIFPTESLATILGCASNIRQMNNRNYDNLNHIVSAIQNVVTMIESIERAKEVKLIKDKEGWDFRFSKERDLEEEKPQPEEVNIDADLVEKVNSAMSHKFINILFPLLGFSELINHSTQNNNDVKEQSRRINELGKKMVGNLSEILKPQHAVKLITDNDGKTTISHVSTPKPQATPTI